MARKALIEKHKRRQKLVAKHAAKRAELIAIIKNEDTDYDDRRAAYRAIAKMPRDASRTRVRNRCELTGRSRGYYRKFGLSRIALRELAHQGQLPGVIKASW